MKKLLLVAVLAMSMVLPVFAAPSPTAEAKAAVANVEVQIAGADTQALTKEVYAAVQDVVTNATHLTNLGVNTAARAAAAFEFEMNIPAGQSVTVPFVVKNAKAGDLAYVLHRNDDLPGAPWEKVGEAILGADLTVTGTFTSTSPVVIMVVDAAEAGAAGVKAPKTGEF